VRVAYAEIAETITRYAKWFSSISIVSSLAGTGARRAHFLTDGEQIVKVGKREEYVRQQE
jgi:hypothetical protein